MLTREQRDTYLIKWRDDLDKALAMPDGKDRYKVLADVFKDANAFMMHEMDSATAAQKSSSLWRER